MKNRIKKEIDRFKSISANSSESAVTRGYIETLLELPWNKASEDNKDLANAERILEEDHYGLEKVKERMLEFLAVRNLTSKGESPIICLVGPPGTGKTSIARSVARALEIEPKLAPFLTADTPPQKAAYAYDEKTAGYRPTVYPEDVPTEI